MQKITVFFIGIVVGIILDYCFIRIYDFLFHKKFKVVHKKLSIGKGFAVLSLPIWGAIALLVFHYTDIFFLFIISAVVGTCLEYFCAWIGDNVFGIRLWVYKYWQLGGGYTSIFSIPYWGGVGLLFVGIAKLAGL